MKLFSLGVCLLSMSCLAKPLPSAQLERELARLEQSYVLDGDQGKMLDALWKDLPHYPPASQMRIRRLACWRLSAEKLGGYQEGRQFAENSLQLASEQHDTLASSELMLCRGWFNQLLGQIPEAFADYDQALALAREQAALELEGKALLYRGSLYSYQGRPAKGLRDLMRALRIFDGLPFSEWRHKAHMDVAMTYRRMELFGPARRALEEIERNLSADSDQTFVYELHLQKAILDNLSGRFEFALRELAKAEKLLVMLAPVKRAFLEQERAKALLGVGRKQEALSLLEQAGNILKPELDALLNSYWHLLMAEARIATGEFVVALGHLATAEPVLRRENNQRFLILLHQLRSEALAGIGDSQGGLAEMRQFVALREQFIKDLQEQSIIWVEGEFELLRQEAENQALLNHQQLQQREIEQVKERRVWIMVVLLLLFGMGASLVFWLLERHRHMQVLAFTDELTGIKNRRRVLAMGDQLLRQARSSGKPFSVLLLDIDHFKRINDTFGHYQGDCILKWVVACIEHRLRPQDLLGRVGGEEFLVLLPGLKLADASQVAERIRGFIAKKSFPGMNSKVTLSLGCAELGSDDGDLGDLIRRADAALYRAKEGGRNRVVKAEG